jgi:hypothetical protein
MNARQASLLIEQAIDVCQSPEPNCPAVEDLEIVAGLLVAFRDGWFAERRRGSKHAPKVPAVPPRLVCKCGNPAAAPHPCPYRVDVDDSTTLCTCCPACSGECMAEI